MAVLQESLSHFAKTGHGVYKISSTNVDANFTPRAAIESSPLYNPDLAPTVMPGEAASGDRGARTWGTYNYAALWVSMSVNI